MNSIDNHLSRYLDSVEKWVKQPFNEKGSVVDWFLFFGLAAVIGYFWTRVIERIGR